MFSGSFYLTDRFDAVPSVSLSEAATTFVNAVSSVFGTGTKITKDITDFATITRLVIENLEGGYYSPKYHSTGDSRYSASGETMFGIDRKAGGTINTTDAGSKFWAKIDQAQTAGRWPWNYIPPDPLRAELVDLVIKIQEPEFNKALSKYVPDPAVQDIIKSDGRLLFNFVYAIWNGPGWFQGWGKIISDSYKKGNTSSEGLLRLFVARRINNANVLRKGNAQNSLIAQGGHKIAGLVQIGPASSSGNPFATAATNLGNTLTQLF